MCVAHDTCLPLYTNSTMPASVPAIFWGSSPGERRTPGRTASTEPHWYGWEECLWCEGQPLKGHELNQETGIGVLCRCTVSPGNGVLVDAPPRATSRSRTHSIMKNAMFYRSLLLCNIGQSVTPEGWGLPRSVRPWKPPIWLDLPMRLGREHMRSRQKDDSCRMTYPKAPCPRCGKPIAPTAPAQANHARACQVQMPACGCTQTTRCEEARRLRDAHATAWETRATLAKMATTREAYGVHLRHAGVTPGQARWEEGA